MGLHRERRGNAWLLWPDTASGSPEDDWFDPTALAERGLVSGGGGGRGATVYFRTSGRELVLRHYRRGGMLRNLLQDHYLAPTLRATRPWNELSTLGYLHGRALPVPAPVAARVTVLWSLPLVYRADLVTARVPDARTLAEALADTHRASVAWGRIGETIARFHETGIDHADLNAHNVLLDDNGRVWLIDFDRARLRATPGHWCERNLTRLRRSLDKSARLDSRIVFTDTDWGALCDGYEAMLPANRSRSAARSSTR